MNEENSTDIRALQVIKPSREKAREMYRFLKNLELVALNVDGVTLRDTNGKRVPRLVDMINGSFYFGFNGCQEKNQSAEGLVFNSVRFFI